MQIIKYIKQPAFLILLNAFILIFATISPVFAETYNVTASIPYPAPITAATVVSPTNNSTVDTSTINITGTCELLSPVSVVSVWNGGILIGSTNCLVGGNYTIDVPLSIGLNTLLVRTSSMSFNYGPDSSPINITYLPKATDTPNSVADTPLSRSNPASQSSPRPTAGSELVLTSESPFGIIDESNSVSITLKIGGGRPPYNLQINWGDGTNFSQVLNESGQYTFTHVYDKSKVYNISALLTDSEGSNRSFNWIVVTSLVQSEDNTPLTLGSDGESSESGIKYSLYVIVSLVVIFFVITTFLFGRYYQAKQDDEQTTKVSNKLKSKK